MQIPETCAHITLYGKRDFADVIELRILKWEDFPRLLGWASWKTKVLINEREKQEMQRQRMRCEAGSRCHSDVIAIFEDERPRNVGSL